MPFLRIVSRTRENFSMNLRILNNIVTILSLLAKEKKTGFYEVTARSAILMHELCEKEIKLYMKNAFNNISIIKVSKYKLLHCCG